MSDVRLAGSYVAQPRAVNFFMIPNRSAHCPLAGNSSQLETRSGLETCFGKYIKKPTQGIPSVHILTNKDIGLVFSFGRKKL